MKAVLEKLPVEVALQRIRGKRKKGRGEKGEREKKMRERESYREKREGRRMAWVGRGREGKGGEKE